MLTKWIINHLAPNLCVRCGDEGALACEECSDFIATRRAETCYRCNKLSPGFRTCKRCRAHSDIRSVIVSSRFESETKQLIYMLKYENCIDASKPLAQMIYAQLSFSGTYDHLVAVPTSGARLRQRGYNQAYEIAKKLGKMLGTKPLPCLRRVDHKEQIGAGRIARFEQVQGSIKGTGRDLSGKRLLLVDDVVTTGATLHECAKALKEMGAKSIDAAVVAK